MASGRWLTALQNVGKMVAPLVRSAPLHGPPVQPRLAPVLPALAVGGTAFALGDDAADQPDVKSRAVRRTRTRIAPVIPTSIEMLVINDIPVQPDLLLKSLPWEELDSEEACQELQKIKAWKERGHFVDPATASNICKRVCTWLLVKEMDTVDAAGPAVISTVSEVLEQSDSDISTVSHCRAKIKRLLKENKVDTAYRCAQQQIDALDQMNELLENARRQIEKAQGSVWGLIMNHLKIAGGCVALYFALELIGTLPIGVGLDSLSCLQEIAMNGGALFLSEAAALGLLSPDYADYMEKVTAKQQRRQLMHQRVSAMMNEILNSNSHAATA